MEKLKKIMLAVHALRLLPDLLAVSGAVSISYGAYLIMPQIGFITLGVILIAGAYILSRAGP